MSQDLADGPPRLKRDIGLLPLFMVSAGSVIGSGWLLATLNASKVAGPAAIVSWIIGVILLIGIALIYAELGSTYPISGSTARFTWIHAGTLGGFFAGTFSYLQAMAVAPIEVEATLGYLDAKYWPGLETRPACSPLRACSSRSPSCSSFTALNLFGIKWMARTNTVAMYWKILVPFRTVIFIMTKVFTPLELHQAGGGFMPYGIKGVFVAIPLGIVFALEGFEQAAQLAGEARNPKRDVPIAVVGSMLLGAALYILLQLCFTGALNPVNIAHGWSAPFGAERRTFGPYYTLATSVGLGWLGVVLIIDAVISPGGTGLVYVSAASRLSYSLAKTRFLPPVFSSIDRRGVPWFSIIFGGVFGCVLFLPFGGWAGLVGAITAASSFMYSFAPGGRGLAAQERPGPRAAVPGAVPEHHRPVQLRGLRLHHLLERHLERGEARPGRALLPHPVLHCPPARPEPGAAGLPGRGVRDPVDHRPDHLLDLRRQLRRRISSPQPAATQVPRRQDHLHLPFWWDLGAIAVFSLIVFYFAVNSRLGPERVHAHAEEAAADAHQEDLDLGVGHPAA